MKTFIVPTDFSPEAENALEYACGAAQQLGARLVLFNSYSFPVHASNARLSASSMRSLEEHNKELLHDRATTLSEKWGLVINYEYGLMVEVSEELDNIVTKYHGDMVFMGMAPKSLAQELFGNTTTSVIMKQKYPVLAVPLESKYSGIKKILFACDDLDQVPKKILDRIREMATVLHAEVEVFRVMAKAKHLATSGGTHGSSKVIDEGLEGVSYYYKNVASAAVISEIEKEVKQIEADLLIMMPKKYGFWDDEGKVAAYEAFLKAWIILDKAFDCYNSQNRLPLDGQADHHMTSFANLNGFAEEEVEELRELRILRSKLLHGFNSISPDDLKPSFNRLKEFCVMIISKLPDEEAKEKLGRKLEKLANFMV